MLTFAPCPSCGKNMAPLQDKLSEHLACFRKGVIRWLQRQTPPFANLRSVMECDYCGHHFYVPKEGTYAGRTDLCPSCAAGDTQREAQERDIAAAERERLFTERFSQVQICDRCDGSFHATIPMKLCHGCVRLLAHDKVCCEKAFYHQSPGDPCGFRICSTHGTVNVEPVD